MTKWWINSNLTWNQPDCPMSVFSHLMTNFQLWYCTVSEKLNFAYISVVFLTNLEGHFYHNTEQNAPTLCSVESMTCSAWMDGVFCLCALRADTVWASWWRRESCRCVGDPDESKSWRIAMRMDAGPPASWGHLLPLRPAGQPSGSPSPEAVMSKEGTKEWMSEWVSNKMNVRPFNMAQISNRRCAHPWRHFFWH